MFSFLSLKSWVSLNNISGSFVWVRTRVPVCSWSSGQLCICTASYYQIGFHAVRTYVQHWWRSCYLTIVSVKISACRLKLKEAGLLFFQLLLSFSQLLSASPQLLSAYCLSQNTIETAKRIRLLSSRTGFRQHAHLNFCSEFSVLYFFFYFSLMKGCKYAMYLWCQKHKPF